ncbi:MAG: hypothetical protein N3G80_00275 [Candidatus Micrarchaeota archaeon]|nr:hypothetical protein [Candidatus Micrarchaeota archaeon]
MVLEQSIQHAKKMEVGSIGSAGLFFDERNSRIKGIHTKLIKSMKDAYEMVELVKDFERRHSQATRTTVRAFVRKPLVEEMRRIQDYKVEAVLPAENALPEFDLVYIGKNSQKRLPDELTAKKEKEILEWVLANVKPISAQQAYERITTAGYYISYAKKEESDVQELLKLYSEAYSRYTFEINEEVITYLFENGNKIIAARNAQRNICSVLVAEKCSLQIENSVVELVELSDFATFRKDRGNGLITALQIFAIELVKKLHPKAIIYAEDRAPWKPVIKSSKEAGMHYAGTLPFHCQIISDRSFNYQLNYEYESLQVFYAR